VLAALGGRVLSTAEIAGQTGSTVAAVGVALCRGVHKGLFTAAGSVGKQKLWRATGVAYVPPTPGPAPKPNSVRTLTLQQKLLRDLSYAVGKQSKAEKSGHVDRRTAPSVEEWVARGGKVKVLPTDWQTPLRYPRPLFVKGSRGA
jgi:hypothetical protein